MSVTLTTLYFLYIAACMFATEAMASPSPMGATLSWSLLLGILLLGITVGLSVLYLYISSDDRNNKEEGK